ncbi:chromate transport protein ChrA [Thermocatellispora tengchongensis]|uniref:Chromate transport protein ChrA n=1 Tax=Thermocatellispora tengchongensis TaxID=1073253 RepID=A0A840P4P3_9ACTN|nr:DUF6113 family protein [Thermocatellispora tengchongensis]MBB5133979.1 chromate transport protein ChrA [Thermocatellispora tengchongensis]
MGEMAPESGATDGPPHGPRWLDPTLLGALYGMLFVLGLVLGVAGGFQHNHYLGEHVPIAAIAWIVLLFGAVYGLGRLMDGRLPAVVIALGWLLASVVFTVERGEGDLVIAANFAGYLYLYGGFAAIVVAVLAVPSRGPSWLLKEHRLSGHRDRGSTQS